MALAWQLPPPRPPVPGPFALMGANWQQLRRAPAAPSNPQPVPGLACHRCRQGQIGLCAGTEQTPLPLLLAAESQEERLVPPVLRPPFRELVRGIRVPVGLLQTEQLQLPQPSSQGRCSADGAAVQRSCRAGMKVSSSLL